MNAAERRKPITIAFLIPVTSRTRKENRVADTPLSCIFLPSLVKSILKEKHTFKIYLGCDEGDLLYCRPEAEMEIKNLIKEQLEKCHDKPCLSLEKLVSFADTSNNPCLVWNRLFRIAFDEKCDFFYQCGDDIEFIDSQWADKFVNALHSFGESLIGVTGPFDVRNPRILTQSFVSRTHMHIFGCYFPTAISNLFCDDWITLVYGPDHIYRFKEEDGTRVFNTPAPIDCPVVRYNPVLIPAAQLEFLVNEGKRMLVRYIAYN